MSRFKKGTTIYYVDHKNNLYLYRINNIFDTEKGVICYAVNYAYKNPTIVFNAKSGRRFVFPTRKEAIDEINKRIEEKNKSRISLKGKITKTIIKDYLKEMIEKHGGTVITFNSNRFATKGAKGFVDHVIFYKYSIYFVEVKIGRDKISSEQKHIANLILDINKQNRNINYIIVTERNYTDFLTMINNNL